jgi:AcrR family transcriptional regulator
MPRTAEANQQIRAERRQQILQAAANVFARKGLSDATIADIAAKAGISHGLLYRHFASKEEVFAAIIEQSLYEAVNLAQAAQEYSGTPWERIRWLTTQIFPHESLRGRPDYFSVVLYALTNEKVPEQVRKQAVKQGETIYMVTRQLIVEGQAIGQVVSGNPDQLTRLYLSCIQGLVIGSMFSKQSEPGQFFVELVLRVLQPGLV